MADGSTSGESFNIAISDFIQKCRTMKEGAFLFRRRRHSDWTDNYTLYRDKVQLNRLTQRQSVNIPLIKSSVKTLLKDIDDPPILYFRSIDNSDEAEMSLNEYWKAQSIWNKLILKDIVDKRQVLLFGRTFKSLNIVNGKFSFTIDDPQDWLVDRYIDPADIDSARFLIHQHIYAPLSSLKSDPKLDNAEVTKLQKYLSSNSGLIKAEENQLDFVEKQKRMASMGVIDVMTPILGETYVELNVFFVKEFDTTLKEDVIQVVITAEDMVTLYKAPLEEVIGETKDHFWRSHFPVVTWGDETERTDFWSDSVADTLRTLNKIMNAWFSQMVENRTLRNFGMNYYNSSLTEEGFTPQTFTPEPWGWYPIPVAQGSKIADQIMRVDVPDLTDDLKEMEFIMTIAQQASAATNFQQGVQSQQQVTLGEIKLLLNNAEQRVKSMAVYYTDCWYDFGLKYSKMLEAAPHLFDDVQLHKKGKLTSKLYSKVITPKDWLTKSGYNIEVKMKEDVLAETADSLQKLNYTKSLMPNNKTLDTIIKKKSLDFADLSASEIAEVMKEEEMQQKMMASMPMGMPNGAPNQPALPAGNSVPQAPQSQPTQLPPVATQ